MSDLVYIAAPLFSEKQRDLIKEIELQLDLRDQEFFSPREYGNISGEKMTAKRMKRIFDMNIRMLDECDTLVAVTDNFDPGTVFEIGVAYTLDKRIITYSDEGYGANVMIKYATFTHCNSMEHLILALDGHEIEPLTVTE